MNKNSKMNQTTIHAADNDTWVEHVVLYKKETNTTRSYFKSEKTNKCVWDEPPSGASRIVLFSERLQNEGEDGEEGR